MSVSWILVTFTLILCHVRLWIIYYLWQCHLLLKYDFTDILWECYFSDFHGMSSFLQWHTQKYAFEANPIILENTNDLRFPSSSHGLNWSLDFFWMWFHDINTIYFERNVYQAINELRYCKVLISTYPSINVILAVKFYPYIV